MSLPNVRPLSCGNTKRSQFSLGFANNVSIAGRLQARPNGLLGRLSLAVSLMLQRRSRDSSWRVPMDFNLTKEQESLVAAVAGICSRFGDDYWLKRDRDGGLPQEFVAALAQNGWLGICVPEEYGGSGLGIFEAGLMMRTIAESGAGMSGASSIHMNIFGLNPVVVFGTDEQRRRMLPPLARGEERSCFAVTEPDTGLNTTRLKTRAR